MKYLLDILRSQLESNTAKNNTEYQNDLHVLINYLKKVTLVDDLEYEDLSVAEWQSLLTIISDMKTRELEINERINLNSVESRIMNLEFTTNLDGLLSPKIENIETQINNEITSVLNKLSFEHIVEEATKQCLKRMSQIEIDKIIDKQITNTLLPHKTTIDNLTNVCTNLKNLEEYIFTSRS